MKQVTDWKLKYKDSEEKRKEIESEIHAYKELAISADKRAKELEL